MLMATVEIRKLGKDQSACEDPVTVKKRGRWKMVQITPRMMLEVRALYFACNLGRANPRQPSSSPFTMPITRNIGRMDRASCKGDKDGSLSERMGNAGEPPTRLRR